MSLAWRTVLSLLLGTALVVGATRMEIYFSPDGGCTDAIVRNLQVATNSVLIQAYSFTSAHIAKAVVAAHRRGLKVTVILDKSQDSERYSSADFLANSGVSTFIDAKHGIAHNKVMILDGVTVITGSFNFTSAAEDRNAENLLVIHDRKVAAKYLKNWKQHALHSEPYLPKSKQQK